MCSAAPAGEITISADSPVITLSAGILALGKRTQEGVLVEALGIPWFQIMEMLKEDPAAMYAIGYREWEEIIAGAYQAAGFDEVILTPRSGDLGRDVIASKRGVGAIRILDQVKAYKPGHLVPANDVRAMLGVATADRNCSKAVVTTTSDFAPLVRTDPLLAPYMPYRLELKSGRELLSWLAALPKTVAPSGVAPPQI